MGLAIWAVTAAISPLSAGHIAGATSYGTVSCIEDHTTWYTESVIEDSHQHGYAREFADQCYGVTGERHNPIRNSKTKHHRLEQDATETSSIYR